MNIFNFLFFEVAKLRIFFEKSYIFYQNKTLCKSNSLCKNWISKYYVFRVINIFFVEAVHKLFSQVKKCGKKNVLLQWYVQTYFLYKCLIYGY